VPNHRQALARQAGSDDLDYHGNRLNIPPLSQASSSTHSQLRSLLHEASYELHGHVVLLVRLLDLDITNFEADFWISA
jgi:hypothetical protein